MLASGGSGIAIGKGSGSGGVGCAAPPAGPGGGSAVCAPGGGGLHLRPAHDRGGGRLARREGGGFPSAAVADGGAMRGGCATGLPVRGRRARAVAGLLGSLCPTHAGCCGGLMTRTLQQRVRSWLRLQVTVTLVSAPRPPLASSCAGSEGSSRSTSPAPVMVVTTSPAPLLLPSPLGARLYLATPSWPRVNTMVLHCQRAERGMEWQL